MVDERRKRRRRWWGPRRWHRYLGAVVALPLLWLCVTGLLLQHSERLGLNERLVSSAWLLERYGQVPEGAPVVVQAGRFTVAGWGDALFLDGKLLEENGTLVGAVAKPAELVIATRDQLFVYDSQGEYLDRLGEASLPGLPVQSVGLLDAGLHVKIDGESFLISDDLLDYEPAALDAGEEIAWSDLEDGRETAQAALREGLAEGSGFTWSRVMTDLHSGSLFGWLGRFLVDLTGIAVIVVTLFGIRLLFRRT